LPQIGTISIGRDMKEALQQDSEELEKQASEGEAGAANGAAIEGAGKKEELSPEAKAAKEAKEKARDEERAKQREERVRKLAETLIRKLSVFTESVRNAQDEQLERQIADSFKEITRIEAEELKTERCVALEGVADTRADRVPPATASSCCTLVSDFPSRTAPLYADAS
jgi:hypothetical protein